jgi:hypothetical protein
MSASPHRTIERARIESNGDEIPARTARRARIESNGDQMPTQTAGGGQ